MLKLFSYICTEKCLILNLNCFLQTHWTTILNVYLVKQMEYFNVPVNWTPSRNAKTSERCMLARRCCSYLCDCPNKLRLSANPFPMWLPQAHVTRRRAPLLCVLHTKRTMLITHPAADKNNLQRGIIFLTDNLSANPCSHYLILKGQAAPNYFNRARIVALAWYLIRHKNSQK